MQKPYVKPLSTMKKTFAIIIVAVLTLCLAGKGQAQNVEESMAKTAWDYLKTNDNGISTILSELNEIDPKGCAEAVHFKSNTAMEFDYEIPYSNNPFGRKDSISVKYQVHCYKTSDRSWIAVVDSRLNIYAFTTKVKESTYEGFSILECKNGKIMSVPKREKFFPGNLCFIDELYSKFVMSDTEINCFSYYAGPLKFVWNGRKFKTSSKPTEKCIAYNGDFHYLSPFEKWFYEKILRKFWTGAPDGCIKNKDGKTIAKFDIKDGIIEGYELLNPAYGIAMDIDEDEFLLSNPVTIGSPMSFALDHLFDAPTTKVFKDGKFVVTQHISQETLYRRRDIYIEFTSKDEKSPIETIRVYSTPLEVTLQSEIDESVLTDDAKTIFKALNFNENDYGYFLWAFTFPNGISIDFGTSEFNPDDWPHNKISVCVEYMIYKADGKYLVVLSEIKYPFENLGAKFWYYENGKLTPTQFALPSPTYKGETESSLYSFTYKGLSYSHYISNNQFVHEDFNWNGSNFVKE